MCVVYVVCVSVCVWCVSGASLLCFVFCHKRIVKANMSFTFLANTYLKIMDISTTFSLLSVEGAR